MKFIENFKFTTHIPAFVAVMVAVAVPLRASGVAAQQAALGLALLAALVVCATSVDTRGYVRQALRSPLGLVVGAIFVAWGVTIFFSYAPFQSLKMGLRTGALIFASVLIWAVLSAHQDVQRRLWKILVGTALTLAVLALLSLNGVPMILSVFKGKVLALEKPELAFKAFAAACMCLIPVVIWAGRKLGGGWPFASYAFLPLALMVMVQTENRAVLAGVVVMTLSAVVLLVVARWRYVVSIYISALVSFGAAAYWLYIVGAEKLVGQVSQEGTYLPLWLVDVHRQFIWKFAFERFLDHPIVGNGIDQLNRLPGANKAVAGLANSAALVPSHPHNWALEILAETGILGFVPVVFALAYIAWQLFKHYKMTLDEGDFALLILGVGFWSSALFNFSIWAAWWQLTFFVLFTIVLAARPRTSA